MSWIIFYTVIAALLILDLGIIQKKNTIMSFKESVLFSLFYIVIACLFGIYVYYNTGTDHAREYYTCLLIEKAMSLDNIFVISIIFQFFKIPWQYQHRVLFFGIIGVIIFRAVMIYGGIILINKFAWLLYIFAVILIATGIKTFYVSDKTFDIQNSYIYKSIINNLNITPNLEGDKFVVKRNNKLYCTPLFISLVLIEAIDLVFAIDSIPAIFAITNDVYIIYTSNIFAILGLRALFFCLAEIVERFSYIKYSLALILIFISFKIFIHHYIAIPEYVAFTVTITLLLFGIIASIIRKNMIDH
ncbi:TerC/Alx family metal homeostasis membrane protein [Rickettsia rickettsii]|uniref:Tellurium resistance protein n=2 Tax=Rickettsia rickettsii TaxID=783 RepID=B0BVA0_RICRO|nr:TerC/Alx family metal homeostasis membrane protein [Rickettsia rickettsii]ABV76785.1 tellurium resistance protein TerC [Rickettsia rickettsii str. 'Sheila Smith']ABY73160.1 tellurium resistance protein [Rickettsia rickettsii str. Iowa]AFB21655.1 tellurium resistance protein TerC [Rickettsia rickettsii str. Brazil]AFB25469.1 tellurium resistance protein TerC [Rickettsia rickettsii str. Arizona]AFB28149.1 tellurium resistance protein TerC [Rickettsia rickettsii str. Hino]